MVAEEAPHALSHLHEVSLSRIVRPVKSLSEGITSAWLDVFSQEYSGLKESLG